MAFGHCKDCRFIGHDRPLTWYGDGENNDWNEHASEHRLCTRVIHGNDYGMGRKAGNELATVVDGSGYSASLCVLPDFGCALFEKKER